MASTALKGSVCPAERKAWSALEASEVELETALRARGGGVVVIGGLAYYLDETQRMLAAPAFADGTPDEFNARHRSEYEPMEDAYMLQLAADIQKWMDENAGR